MWLANGLWITGLTYSPCFPPECPCHWPQKGALSPMLNTSPSLPVHLAPKGTSGGACWAPLSIPDESAEPWHKALRGLRERRPTGLPPTPRCWSTCTLTTQAPHQGCFKQTSPHLQYAADAEYFLPVPNPWLLSPSCSQDPKRWILFPGGIDTVLRLPPRFSGSTANRLLSALRLQRHDLSFPSTSGFHLVIWPMVWQSERTPLNSGFSWFCLGQLDEAPRTLPRTHFRCCCNTGAVGFTVLSWLYILGFRLLGSMPDSEVSTLCHTDNVFYDNTWKM